MKTIQVFDPALCCSSGVCGSDVDQGLIDFSADVAWAKQSGAQVERFNMAHEPMAFAENATVRDFLERCGAASLPLTLVDGEVAVSGRYPSRTELANWAQIAQPSQALSQGNCCSGGRCC